MGFYNEFIIKTLSLVKIKIMKKLLSVLLVLGVFSTHLFSQTIKKDLDEKKIGTLNCSYKMSVKVGESDTSFYIYCSFQNQKYSSITDIGSVFISTIEGKDRIVSDLKECVKYMDDKTISFTLNEFALYDFSKNLYINDERGVRKYTTMRKKNVLKWIEWLESIKKINM
mgnify:CR=1 FL=1